MKPDDLPPAKDYTAKKKYSPPSIEEIRRLYAELGLGVPERFQMVTVDKYSGFVTVHLSDAGMVAEVIGSGLAPEFHARPRCEQ